MNAIKLKSIINKKVKEKDATHQELYDIYFFEQFLKKISLSKYSKTLILKGGFLLENIVGIEERTTLDIDFSYQSKIVNERIVERMINEIIKIESDSQVVFEFKEVFKINEESKYDGFRIKLNAKLDNLKKTFSIDIASGDYITPEPSKYEFKSNVLDSSFYVYAYNIETILAEKFETLIKREIENTRMKDFYDIHILVNHQEFRPNEFHNAFINTFEKRGTDYNKKILLSTIDIISDSQVMKNRYDDYISNNRFAKETSFTMIMESVYKLFREIKFIGEEKLNAMNLIIVRHAEDDVDKLGGWSDSNLTEKGIRQAENLSQLLKDGVNEIDVFISSDLARANQTSQILSNSLGISYLTDEGFRETNNGDLANVTKTEFTKKHENLYFSNLNMKEKYPNGESPQEFYDRIKNAFLSLNKQHINKSILLVTHAGVYGVIKAIVNGIEWNNKQKYHIEYAEIKRFNISNAE